MVSKNRPRSSDQTRAGRWSGIVALGWAVAFVVLGLVSAPPTPQMPGRVDLVGHFLASALLALLVTEWLTVARGLPAPVARRWGFSLAIALGMAIELLQTLAPVRTFEAADLLADLLGCAAGSWAHRVVSARLRPRRRVTAGLNWVGVAAVMVVAGSFLVA